MKKIRMFWKEFEKIKSQIGPELKRLSEMIEIQKLSEEVHEKIVRQILPEATDDQVNFIVYDYSEISPFCYAHWRDGLMEVSDEDVGIEVINDVYKRVARIVIDNPNPLGMVIFIEIDLFGRDEDEDLSCYYANKYVKTHEHAMIVWKEKIASERKEFEKTLKAWVGLFVPDESVSEHYYQVISETLSPYSVR